MSLSSDFYEEQRKKKKPSQVAADSPSGSETASQSFLNTAKSGGYKTTTTPSTAKPQPVEVAKPKTPSLIDRVKGAVDSVAKAFQPQKIIAPIPEKDIIKTVPKEKTFLEKTFETNQQFGGPANPIAIAINTINIIDAAYKGLDQFIVGSQDAIYKSALIEGTDKETTRDQIILSIAKPLAVAQKKIIEPVLFNKATAPIMKGFAETYLGGSKQVMATLETKIQPTNNPLMQGYNTVGELTGAVIAFLAGGQVIKGLQLGKATLPVLFGTIGQTSAAPDTTVMQRLEKLPVDVVAGWLLSKVPAAKKLLSPQALKQAGIAAGILGGQSLINSLIVGLPKEKAVEAAVKMAIIAGLFHIGGTATGLFTNKLLTSKYGSGKIELTPEQARVQMNATDLSKPEAVKARNVLEKATLQAEREGKNLLIDINVTEKSAVAKLFNAKTPQGRAFTIELVEAKQIKLIGEEGAPSKPGAPVPKPVPAPVRQTDVPPENLPPVIAKEFAKREAEKSGDAPTTIPQELQPLVEEARKYKSAEELLRNQFGDVLTPVKPVGDLWKSKDNTIFVESKRPGMINWLRQKKNVIESADEAGNNIIRVVVKKDLISTQATGGVKPVGEPITVKDTDELLTYIDRQGYRTPEQIATLKADIIKNGIKYPIELIDNGDGTFEINDGTHRIQIAKDLGIKELPVKIVKTKGKVAQQPVFQEFKIGDVLDPQGNTNMVGKVTIREITGNTLKFVDSKGTEFAGMQRSLVRDLVKGNSWKRVPVSDTTPPPSKEVPKKPSQAQKKQEGIGRVGEPIIKSFDKKGREISSEKKGSFSTKGAKAAQAIFVEKIAKIGITANSQAELIAKVEPFIDESIANAGNDKEVLRGLRTALNKEMFGYIGYSGNYKADYATLRTMMDSPDIGDYLGILETKIAEIDNILTTGDVSYSSSKASIGDYAELPNRTTEIKDVPAVEFPEMVKIAKTLMGQYPIVRTPRFRPSLGGRPGGVFFATQNGKIILNPEIFKDPVQAAKTLAHELGHLADYLPDKTLSRGNLLGRIASLNKYMKTMLREFPGSEGELLTTKERAKIKRAAEKEGKTNYEIITKEIEVGTEPTNPEEILSIWRDATVGIKNKELLAYIQGLSDAQKKEIAINAMRGKIPEWVNFVHSIKETITQKVLKNSPSDIRKIYQRMVKEEIVKRHFFDLLTIKRELQVLSNKWRPVDLNLAPEGYLTYRKDPAELYADAISVLFNDPVLLKEEAPTFWKAFFNYLDVKPEVKDALFSTWDLLNKGEEAVFQSRQADVEQMFDNSEQQFTVKNLEKQKQKTNFIYTLKLLFDSKNTPLKRKVNIARKKGSLIDSNLDPVFAYEGLSYMDGKLENLVQQNYQPLFENAQKISDDGWTKLGSILLYERSLNERGELANPLGYSPKTAQDQLAGLEKSMTPQDWKAIQEVLKSFREVTQKIVKMADEGEFYPPDLLKQMKANDSYATYQVIDYLDTYISAHVNKSIGTLKEIANPATSTVMKGISVVKAIERNNAKKIAVNFFKANFPDEITPAKSVFKGKRMEFIESKDMDLAMVKLIEKGKMTAYYVEKDLADNINNTSNETIIKTAKIMRVLTASGIYRPLFTSLNLGFSTFNFIRDFQRYWTNVPDYTLAQAITSFPRALYRYGQAIPAAKARATNKLHPTITAMKELNIIGASYNGVFEHQEVSPDDMQIERIMKQYGLLDKTKKRRIFTPIYNVLDGIEAFNNFIETLPKVAGYNEIKGSGRMTDLEMADFIRTKVGSPNFRSKGQLTPITNSILLFSNAIKEGIKSDIQVAAGKAGKQSAGGFWWKTTVSTFLPTMLMFAAGAGLLGKWLEDRFKDISEYDKTNFTIIPTGVDKNGKTTYIRVPRAETQRFVGGLFYKIMRTAERKDLKLEDVFDVFDYGAGQLPNITPLWSGGGALLSYLSGNNPYDSFRNRNIIPEIEFNAGFKDSLPIFVDWFVKNQGAGIILPSYVDKNPTDLQKKLALPFISNVVGRWIKVSDYGQTEANRRITDKIESEAAKKTLDTRQKLDDAIKEYKGGTQSYTRRKQIERQLVKDVVGTVRTSDEKSAKTRLIKKFEMGLLRGSADPLTDSIIDANTNGAKVELIYAAKDKLGSGYKDYIRELKRKNVISDDVTAKLRRKK